MALADEGEVDALAAQENAAGEKQGEGYFESEVLCHQDKNGEC